MRLLIALLLGLTVAACDKAKPNQPQAEATQAAPAAAPPEAEGRVDLASRGKEAPAVPFLGPDGGPATLATFRGKPLMVNLWATWCAPCVAEMPTLDALAGEEKGRFRLVTISQDIAGKRAVGPFFDKGGFKNLQPFLDKQNVLMEALKIDSLPMTIFYDASGKEQWRVLGSMDWRSAKAKALIEDGLAGRPVKG